MGGPSQAIEAQRPEVNAPGPDACAGGSLAVPARPQPPTVCHAQWLAYEQGPKTALAPTLDSGRFSGGFRASIDC